MMTRKTVAQNTEAKLRQALNELKVSRETCNQLLRERDESEDEIKIIVGKNSTLKSELATLSSRHNEVLYQQDQRNVLLNRSITATPPTRKPLIASPS